MKQHRHHSIAWAAILLLLVISQDASATEPDEDDAPFSDDYYNWQIEGALNCLELSALPEAHAAAARMLAELPVAKLELLIKQLQKRDTAIIVSRLMTLIRNNHSVTGMYAVYTLRNMKEHAASAVPQLVKALSSSDDNVRCRAAEAIGNMKKYAVSAVPELLKALSSENESVRYCAISAIGNMGRYAASAVPQLIMVLSDNEHSVRHEAADALGKIGEHASAAIPQLVEALSSDDILYRTSAIDALGNMGGQAGAAAPQLIEALVDSDSNVRQGAIVALGNFGVHAAAAAPQLATAVFDKDFEIRISAVFALGKLGEHAISAVPLLISALTDNNVSVRGDAASALGKIGQHAASAVPQLIRALSDNERYVRERAAVALGNMGEQAVVAVPHLIIALADNNVFVRSSVATALGNMGEYAVTAIPQLIIALSEKEEPVRASAATALGKMGEYAASAVPQLIRALSDRDAHVRDSAVSALGYMREYAAAAVPQLIIAMSDKDERVRNSTIVALGNLGEHAAAAVPQLISALSEDDEQVRERSVSALAQMGEYAAVAVPQLVRALSDSNEYFRAGAASAIHKIGERAARHSLLIASAIDDIMNIEPEQLWLLSEIGRAPPIQRVLVVQRCLDIANRSESVSGMAILLGFLHSSSDAQIMLAIRWLEDSQPVPDLAILSSKDANSVLNALLPIWTESTKDKNDSPRLRLLVKSRIETVLKTADEKGLWTANDLTALNKVDKALADDPSDTLTQLIARLEQRDKWRDYGSRLGLGALSHLFFWILLWFAYPRFKPVQAIFFWNKWVRRFLGFGYVGLLLTWVPALRRRLLKPFADKLVEEAKLGGQSSKVYFGESLVRCEGSREEGSITQIIQRLDGKILLEGDSGFGKTQFVKHLLRQGAARGRVSVYLPARLCDKGVFEAVKSKLLGFAKDDMFLKSILYSDGLDVYIDGLNEVGLATRQQVVDFARRPGVGHLMIVTQPMDWEPPGALKIYHLQPLTPAQLVTFAQSRWPALKDEAKIEKSEFNTQCKVLLRRAAAPSEESKQSNEHSKLDDWDYRVLSNPMDLTAATQIIAKGNHPNVQGLYAQQYSVMANDYNQRQKTAFPLNLFKERAFEMRLNDESALNTNGIPAAAFNLLAAHHLILRRVSSKDNGPTLSESPSDAWVFRHDKVWDFFIAKAFSGDIDRQNEYMNDSRFRGTYLMLIQEEPLDAARDLEKRLSDYAAKTKDHSVSDDARLLLRDREQHEKAQAQTDGNPEK